MIVDAWKANLRNVALLNYPLISYSRDANGVEQATTLLEDRWIDDDL